MDINLDNIMELLKQSQLNDTINQDIDNTIPIKEPQPESNSLK